LCDNLLWLSLLVANTLFIMRFLKVGASPELTLTKDLSTPPASYAILSHTWGEDDDEVTFDDLEKKTGTSKVGYAKLWFCADRALADGLEYCWVDTCCTWECHPHR
jgi:hypothetical protein